MRGVRRCGHGIEQLCITDTVVGGAVPATPIMKVPQVDLLCCVLVRGVAGLAVVTLPQAGVIVVRAISLGGGVYTSNLQAVCNMVVCAVSIMMMLTK